MINLTSQYPSTVFLPVASTQLIAQVNTINSSGIPIVPFPKQYARLNSGTAPDGSTALTSQVDVLLGPNALYAFQTFKDAQSYAQVAGSQVVNNACFYVESISPQYYSIVIWGPP